MLVLSRKCQQAVVVEGCGGPTQRLIVTVVEIRGARVKLGFDVAKEVVIHRQEVWDQINGIPQGDAVPDGNDAPAKVSASLSAPIRRIAE